MGVDFGAQRGSEQWDLDVDGAEEMADSKEVHAPGGSLAKRPQREEAKTRRNHRHRRTRALWDRRRWPREQPSQRRPKGCQHVQR